MDRGTSAGPARGGTRKRARAYQASSDAENEAGSSRRQRKAKSGSAGATSPTAGVGPSQASGEPRHPRREEEKVAARERRHGDHKRKAKSSRPSVRPPSMTEHPKRGPSAQRELSAVDEQSSGKADVAETSAGSSNRLRKMSKSSASKDGERDTEESVANRREAEKDEQHAALVKTLQAELGRLQKEITFKDSIIDAQKDTIGHIHSQFTCAVCMDLVWRPHVLTPCGHVFCARCLLAYFKRPLPEEEHDGRSEPTAEQRRKATLRRKKLCPHCREQVKVAPAEVWLIKGLLDRVEDSMNRGEGHEDGSTAPNEATTSLPERKGMDLPLGEDLWKDVFYKGRTDFEPFFDEQDGVYRCPHCANEVVEGRCTNPGCDFGAFYEDYSDYDESEAIDFEHRSAEIRGEYRSWPFPFGGPAYDYEGEDYDSEFDSDFEEDEDAGSFIDDGPIEVDGTTTEEEEDDDDAEVQEVDSQGRPIRRRSRRIHVVDDLENLDEEGDSVDENHSDTFDREDEGQAFEDAQQDYEGEESVSHSSNEDLTDDLDDGSEVRFDQAW